MSVYEDAPEISFGEGALSPEQCFARASRALETAERAVNAVAYLVAGNDDAVALQEQVEIADKRIAIGIGWAQLGAALRRAER